VSLAELIADLAGRGVDLWADAGQLRFRGPSGALTDTDKDALRSRKAELIAYLAARAAAPRPFSPPPPGALVASPNQRVWWDLVYGLPAQLRMERVPFVLPLASASVEAAEAAARALVARHAVLRMHFTAGPDGPIPAINDAADFAVRTETVDDPAALPGRALAFAMEPHPVDGPWLTRAAVLSAPGGPTCIVLCFHHIMFDGTSLGLVADELKRDLSGQTVTAEGAPFTAYAAWERAWFDSGAAEPLIGWWRDWLACIPALTTPGGGSLDWLPGARVDHPLALPADIGAKIAAKAVETRSTPFAVILAVFAAALAEWSGQERFPIRSIGDLRTSQDLARTVGLLICADPMEVVAPPGGDFGELVRRMAAEYDSAVSLRLPTHPAGTGVGSSEFHERIGATVNYAPAPPRPQYAGDAAREAPWPAAPNRAQRLDWPAPLASIYLRMGETKDGLLGRLEFNEAVATDAEQADLVRIIERIFAAL
jgi:hypothetical protein